MFRKKSLENGGFFDSAARGKALDVQILGVNDMGLAVHDQVGDNAAGSGRMHYAVAAEAVGVVESADLGRGTQDGVVVGRHAVETGPAAARVHGQVGEIRDASGGVRENRLDECGIEVGAKPVLLIGSGLTLVL